MANHGYTADDNKIIFDLMSLHPLTKFDEKNFVSLLQGSLSLSVAEKKRVVDAVPTLSQYQIDELHKVFEDERIEFKKLMPTEGEVIKKLLLEKSAEWKKLKQFYIDEIEKRKMQNKDQDNIENIKKNLGL